MSFTPRSRALVRRRAGEGRQERVVDVDHRHADRVEEVARQDLHVARQDDEVEVSGQQLELAALGLALRVGADRDVDERDAERAHVVGEIGVVRDHEPDVEVELVAPRPPQQIEQAVVVAADHDRAALGQAGGGERPVHPEPRPDLGGEAPLEVQAHRRQARAVKDRAQEERASLGVGRVLV
jgi:hypothetical protein